MSDPYGSPEIAEAHKQAFEWYGRPDGSDTSDGSDTP